MCDHREELEALGVRVLLLSFGKEWQAKRWLQETMAPFPLLLDPERTVYRAYGLGRSVAKAWHPRMFLLYFRLLRKGRKLRPIQGDPYQLGGDFLVDGQGLVRYTHPSEDPSDRPSLQELLQAVRNIEPAFPQSLSGPE